MLDLTNAVVYDIETFPNMISVTAETLFGDMVSVWEMSEYRDDRAQFFEWLTWLSRTGTPMIGFNSIGFDYPVIHELYNRPHSSVSEIYAKSQTIISSNDRFGHIIWDRDRIATQIDLFKVHHFDNRAKTTSLKALEINMRSNFVVECPVPFGTRLTREQVEQVIAYNKHDVRETKQFAHHSMDAIKFRIGLIEQFGLEVLNYNDGKIGAKMLEQRIGEDICYDRSSGRKAPRQTPRNRIALNEIIFPYVHFANPEFNRVLDFMRNQVLTPDDINDPDAPVKTKGVFTGVTANVGGIEFVFGTGGVHASVEKQKFVATEEWLIRDIDVAALYPSIAIVNKLAPEHLGTAFTQPYSNIPIERAQHAKGTYANGALKLAANVPWGQSNNKFSIFYDPKYAMTIPINGQLMICMLAEQLLTVPTLTLIQANTDGITYRIHKTMEPFAVEICKQWEAYTCLKLEDANYKRMWIRDVNNYIAEDTKGKLKQKGAYWHPEPGDGYAKSISNASPPCWYKDLGNIVSTRAAIAAMTQGIPPEAFIRLHHDKFDFMCRARADRSSTLAIGGRHVQNTTRYYVSTDGGVMTKTSPPAGPLGEYKRRNGLSEMEYQSIASTLPAGAWDERIHTKNKSRYQLRESAVEAGWKVTDCNDASSFRFENVDYAYYVAEANKLIIS